MLGYAPMYRIQDLQKQCRLKVRNYSVGRIWLRYPDFYPLLYSCCCPGAQLVEVKMVIDITPNLNHTALAEESGARSVEVGCGGTRNARDVDGSCAMRRGRTSRPPRKIQHFHEIPLSAIVLS